MAFCEGCPLRGRCTGEIDELELRTIKGRRFGTGPFFAAFAALRDVRGGLSRIFNMPTDMSPQAVMEVVNDCEYPVVEDKGFIRRRQVTTCRALGEYVCRDSQLEKLADQAMSVPASVIGK